MFTSVYGQEAQDRISILHNFVSPVDEKMLSRTLPESGANQKLKVVFVGRLEHEKGLAIIVDALSKAHHLCTTLEMDVYGGGSLGNWFCRRMAEQLGSNFRYNGVVPRSQIRQSLSQYDVILLPSLFGEGLPMAMLEAMSAGCVPFVSALASVPLVVQDGVTGVLLQPGSSDDLADKLAWAVHNPQKLLQISDSAAMHVRNNYSPLDFKRSLLAIYASELPGALPGSIKTNGGRAGNRN